MNEQPRDKVEGKQDFLGHISVSKIAKLFKPFPLLQNKRLDMSQQQWKDRFRMKLLFYCIK